MLSVPHLSLTFAASVVLAGVLTLTVVAPAGAVPVRSENAPVISSGVGEGRAGLVVADRKPKIKYPRVGKKTWKMATGHSKVAGKRGPLLKYRVVVENGITGITANQFAARVVSTLSDQRSWIGTGEARLQRVPNSAKYDFTIYLVTPQTRDYLCGDDAAGRTDRYTSCRNRNRVVLNVARWVHGVPDYGASLERYRTYMINHETGHRLGHGHQKCPGKGAPAPVMQQQTLGLHGCTANGWPRIDGKLYRGPVGTYNDPIPKA